MTDAAPLPLTCPICHGTNFTVSRNGFPIAHSLYSCAACGTRLSQSGSGAKALYQVVYVPDEYSNCLMLFQGGKWTTQDLRSDQLSVYSDAALAAMVQGELPEDILAPYDEVPPFALEEGEVLVFALRPVYSFQERINPNLPGFSFSFRRTVGRWGAVKPLPDPNRSNVIETLDSGSLYLTTGRYSFQGSEHVTLEPLQKISSVFPLSDGMGIVRSNHNRVEYYKGGYHWPLIAAVLRGLIHRVEKPPKDQQA